MKYSIVILLVGLFAVHAQDLPDLAVDPTQPDVEQPDVTASIMCDNGEWIDGVRQNNTHGPETVECFAREGYPPACQTKVEVRKILVDGGSAGPTEGQRVAAWKHCKTTNSCYNNARANPVDCNPENVDELDVRVCFSCCDASGCNDGVPTVDQVAAYTVPEE